MLIQNIRLATSQPLSPFAIETSCHAPRSLEFCHIAAVSCGLAARTPRSFEICEVLNNNLLLLATRLLVRFVHKKQPRTIRLT